MQDRSELFRVSGVDLSRRDYEPSDEIEHTALDLADRSAAGGERLGVRYQGGAVARSRLRFDGGDPDLSLYPNKRANQPAFSLAGRKQHPSPVAAHSIHASTTDVTSCPIMETGCISPIRAGIPEPHQRVVAD